MIATHTTIRVGLVLGSLLLSGSAWADDRERQVATEINKANEVLRGGDVDGAVKAYQKVQEGTTARSDLSYNMAVAQYRKGDMASAQQLFKQSATAENDAVAAKARFNLGNCNYAAALKQAESDRAGAIKGLNDAISDYRSALEVDPNDADSRANIELASAMIDKLREQEKKDQQQKDQQQKDQQQKDQQQKDQQQKDQQQKGGEKNEQKQDKPQSSENKQQQDQQKADEKKEQQKPEQSQGKDSKEQKESQDKEPKSGDDKKNEKPEPKDSKSEGKDSKEQQSQEKQSADQKQQPRPTTQKNSKDKQPEQEPAAQADEKKEQGKAAPKGSLTAADEKAGKDEQKEKAAAAEMAPDGTMTVQEAEKMLQSIRDQEMLRRLKRQATERNQHVPVDRDW